MRYLLSGILMACLLSYNASAQDENTPDEINVAPTIDLLDLATGAVVLTTTSEYDEGKWSALSLIDGTTQTGWASKKFAINDNEFIIELPQATVLEQFVFDTNGIDSVGRGARNFVLSGSATSSTDGYIDLLAAEAPEGERTEYAVSHDKEVRWLRLSAVDNWGAADYTEIMELEAYGTISPVVSPSQVGGVYATNYNLMRLGQSGRSVDGCYDHDNGRLNGDTDGRVVRFEWREDGPIQIGTAIMVLTADAQYLNGLWYEGGALKGVWRGPLVTDGREPKCTLGETNTVADALEQGGVATLYGIRFDLDSDRLRADSTSTLNALLDALNAKPSWRISIEGHTDSQGVDEYNLNLSARRAAAVKTWLVVNGIKDMRMTTSGKGESEPQAGNDTPQGRALNRRVGVRIISK